MSHTADSRLRGADLLLDADRTRRRAWTLRALGACAAAFGALFQQVLSPAVGGLLLAGGLLLLAVAEESRRKAGRLSRHARRAARLELAQRHRGRFPSQPGRAA